MSTLLRQTVQCQLHCHDLIVWQRFCEPSPDLTLSQANWNQSVSLGVSVCLLEFSINLILFYIILTQRVPSLPDTADCKSVHFHISHALPMVVSLCKPYSWTHESKRTPSQGGGDITIT